MKELVQIRNQTEGILVVDRSLMGTDAMIVENAMQLRSN